ncbi:polysaccharide deacetylase family protein [Nocardia sp. NPDC051030]|uniref:polysaccharide deacetylase family protein n=1 Tax=Nocardia sp. NPDC051030 TaxID=3155162 RepID=UPI00341626AB
MKRGSAVVLRIALAALSCAALAACGGAPNAATPALTSTSPPAAQPPRPDPAAVAANELGVIPILMYHQLSANPAGDYDQTPDEFRAELERLYRENYRPITVAQYISGDIDIPAGTHPVVLTFDDSTRSQLSFADNGSPTPDCAIGILQTLSAQHPDFAARATMYVNNEPFGNDPRALPWLAAHGYEIGDHTADHSNLGRLDAANVQREFVENLRAITAAAPGYKVRTMALPLGIFPTDHALASAGAWDGTPYQFEAVMLVGANPAPAPYGQVDPAAVPRIRSGRGEVPFDSAYWLDHLAADPAQRFTSDGDPTRISFPRNLAADLNARWSGRSNPY